MTYIRLLVCSPFTLGVLLVAVLLAAALNLWLPVKLRFASPAMNYWAVCVLAATLPVAAATLVALIVPVRRWATFGVVCLFCAIPCWAIALFAYYEAVSVQEQGDDGSFLLLDSLAVENVNYRLYLSDCGATCSWGMVLRAERDGPFGMKLVRSIWSEYRTLDEAQLTQVGPGVLRVVEKDGTAHDFRY